MAQLPKAVIGAVFYNESTKIKELLDRFVKLKLELPYKILFINDGSTDNTKKIIEEFLKKSKIKNALLINNFQNKGVGAAIKKAIQYGLKKDYDICVIMAGNGKDNPLEIPLLLKPIIEEDFDYVQGSRFLSGGSFKNLPFVRKTLIRGFTFLVYLLTGFKSTDSSNGFRSYKLSLFQDRKINVFQNWLDRYELETYLHYKVITLGYKVTEVPVSKDYLPGVKKYSKIRPVVDWWKMVRPLFLLKLKLKK